MDQAVELTQEALGTVATQTRAVGERAAKLVGIELPKKEELELPPRSSRQEDSGRQEGACQEGSGQEGSGQEGHPEVIRAELGSDR